MTLVTEKIGVVVLNSVENEVSVLGTIVKLVLVKIGVVVLACVKIVVSLSDAVETLVVVEREVNVSIFVDVVPLVGMTGKLVDVKTTVDVFVDLITLEDGGTIDVTSLLRVLVTGGIIFEEVLVICVVFVEDFVSFEQSVSVSVVCFLLE